jgi:CBS domain-containing protein
LWLHFPASKEALSKEPLSSFLEPVPSQTLKPDDTLEQALATLTKNGLGFLFVLDNEQCLVGVLNVTDITSALLLISSTPVESRRDATEVQVRELLSADPIMVSVDDPSLLVASTMLEHGLNCIPVVVSKHDHHLKGAVRAERIGYWMLQELGKDTLIAGQTATLGEELQEQRRTLRSA